MNSTVPEKYFVFVHRDLQYALPVLNVLEIVETPTLLPFHGVLAGCLGNVSHREHLLPILDPTAMGTQRESLGTQSKSFIVVAHSGALYGLAMDRFVAVVSLKGSDGVGAAQPQTQTCENPHVESVRAFRDNALLMLSPESMALLVQKDCGNQAFLNENEREETTQKIVNRAESQHQVYLCARIDRIRFGIPVDQIIEVIEGYDVTPLFKMPPILRGLLNLRGQVLACLDISSELGLTPRTLEERNQFVVLQGDGAVLALCVDKVNGIRGIASDRIQNTDSLLSGAMTRFATGVLEEPDGALFLMSVSSVFDSPQLQHCRRLEV